MHEIVAAIALMCVCVSNTPQTSENPAENKPDTNVRITNIEPPQGGLGSTITLTISNPPKSDSSKKWILYFDGVPLRWIESDTPDFVRISEGEGKITFRLRRAEEFKDSWLTLFKDGKWEWDRKVTVQIGTDKGIEPSIGATPQNFKLILHRKPNLGFAAVGVLSALIFFISLARSTNLLRVSGTREFSPKSPYSLGLSQMAFWFYLCLVSYIYIGITTWNFSTSISNTILTLMGISAGTAIGSLAINGERNRSRVSLVAEEAAIKSEVANLSINPGAANTDQVVQKIAENEKRLKEIDDSLRSIGRDEPVTKGFLMDLLQDDAGFSLHRFQIVCWTLILGIVFVREVALHLAMPCFSEQLLALMGISSGTYLGFALPLTRR